jgi:hypothetical protein
MREKMRFYTKSPVVCSPTMIHSPLHLYKFTYCCPLRVYSALTRLPLPDDTSLRPSFQLAFCERRSRTLTSYLTLSSTSWCGTGRLRNAHIVSSSTLSGVCPAWKSLLSAQAHRLGTRCIHRSLLPVLVLMSRCGIGML